ncbi:hypothetical protein [Pseudomarimonas arenosa]|uniref:Inverse autotransporter beta-domain domain-containing protein n=1 Tax=Pseudomarimonas arenosa TaxID=2774145 RepID=A0AAW3ZJ68_9GAMM|nr:hypothetical protein [Pseudomarimonas arenosa]MBD8524980.1 hypothetical protein [Pseudomarimonas arenosa]
MLKRTLLTLLSCWSLGAFAQAQPERPLLPTQLAGESAAWQLSTRSSALPNSSADLDQWLGALQPRMGQQDSRLRGFLREESSLARDALCNDSSALTGPWGSLAELCLGTMLESPNRNPFGALQAGVNYGVQLNDIGWLDISYGLGWLQNYQNLEASSLSANWSPTGVVDPMVSLQPNPALWPQVDGHFQTLSGQIWLSDRSWLRVSGNQVRMRAEQTAQWLFPRSWNHSSISVDAGYGAFAGSVVGHRSRAPWRPDGLFDVDLGISWRTPWAGKLTVGARNVLNSAEQSLPQTAEAENPLLQGRTPYVRYQQDL